MSALSGSNINRMFLSVCTDLPHFKTLGINRLKLIEELEAQNEASKTPEENQLSLIGIPKESKISIVGSKRSERGCSC